jgi:hypothetical protein
MNTDTNISRRRLLARTPAIAAAAAVPTAGIAIPGPTAIPDLLDGRKVRGLAEILVQLEEMPKAEVTARRQQGAFWG